MNTAFTYDKLEVGTIIYTNKGEFMFTYNFIQWLLFFYIYCFLGWIIESTIVSFSEKRLVNRGYNKGPLLPIYGFGAITVLFVTLPIKNNILLVYLFGLVSATILEYFTGWLMETTLKMKYWDYSEDWLNFKGRICLRSSLFWGVLSVLLTLLIHTPIEKLVLNINNISPLTIIISIAFLIDFTYSTHKILSLNRLLTLINKAKSEIEEMYVQIKESTKLPEKYNTESLKNKLNELSISINKYKISHESLIKAYPRAYSKIFNNPLKDLKSRLVKMVEDYKKDDRLHK